MEYYAYYNLKMDPFVKNSLIGHQPFQSNDYDLAINQMEKATDRNGLCVITGKSGCGKSQATHRFISNIEASCHVCVSIEPGEIPPTDFYKLICMELRIDPTGKLATVRANVKRHVKDYYTRKRPLILIINEAQDLSPKTLKELRNLMSYDNDTLDAMTLILVGEPRLYRILQSKEELHSLFERITNYYVLSGLKSDEIKAYVTHKLSFAGGSDVLVDEAVYPLLSEYGDGNSRKVDKIMTNAMAYSAQLGRKLIDAEAAKYAIAHLPGV